MCVCLATGEEIRECYLRTFCKLKILRNRETLVNKVVGERLDEGFSLNELIFQISLLSFPYYITKNSNRAIFNFIKNDY